MPLLKYIPLLALFLLSACDMTEYPHPESEYRSELLVFSGMTMISPLMEISTIFEQQEGCRVKFSYGGSGHIMRSVDVNQVGDVFFPGDESYVRQLKDRGIITRTTVIGHNVAGFFVEKGNPYKIEADIRSLLDPDLRVVIGSPRAGAIGRETQRILDHAGIYQDVVDHALFMTTDSKGLVQAIKRRDADLAVNWRAVYFLADNSQKMDFIALPDKQAHKQLIVMGELVYSQEPELARRFVELAASPQGQAIFAKYGFRD